VKEKKQSSDISTILIDKKKGHIYFWMCPFFNVYPFFPSLEKRACLPAGRGRGDF
jgi:hypothetical protein